MSWEIVIGLEIHAQLATASKIFSGASTRYGAAPNSQASLLDLGYPGTLPVLNAEAVRMAIKFGLATGCEISRARAGFQLPSRKCSPARSTPRCSNPSAHSRAWRVGCSWRRRRKWLGRSCTPYTNGPGTFT